MIPSPPRSSAWKGSGSYATIGALATSGLLPKVTIGVVLRGVLLIALLGGVSAALGAASLRGVDVLMVDELLSSFPTAVVVVVLT